MKCPHCKSEDTEAIGYSMFDVVFECQSCDEEFEIERNFDSEHYVKELKGERYAFWTDPKRD